MTVTFSQPKRFLVKPPVIKEASSVEIIRVIDLPSKKTVRVLLLGIGFVDLPSLSGANYDNPPWTNDLVVQALQNLASV